jgi:cell wall-associated NlpC family hydrolase
MIRPRASLHSSIAALAALSALCIAITAHAAPGTPSGSTAAPATGTGDQVLQFLLDKGLVPAKAEADKVINQARDIASDLVLSAMNFLGVPYRRGGNSADEGFDCSGFTRHIFESSIGMVLPRRADQQASDGKLAAVTREELRPGDLVFFNTMKRAFSHVGIYMGEGKFIHAPRAGAQVRIEDMREAYWVQRYNGARRADLPEVTGAASDLAGRDAAARNALR